MKPITLLLAAGSLLLSAQGLSAQTDGSGKKEYWNANTLLIPYRLPPAPAGYKPTYIDLDGDGDPDILRTVTANGIPVQWIDDDDDMQYGDLEGDTDNDCLMIDRNKDGVYGGYGDLIIDWVGEDEDGNPAMQVVVDNIPEANRMKTGNGHYMWVVDTDKDDVFNYIDWNTFTDGNPAAVRRKAGSAVYACVHKVPAYVINRQYRADCLINMHQPQYFL